MTTICDSLKNFASGIWRKIMVKKARILFIGIENSGKSEFIPKLFDEKVESDKCENYKPTLRVTARKYEKDRFSFVCYDMPGAKSQRNKWDHYFKRSDIHVFLVSSVCTVEEMEESRDELQGLIYRNTWIKRPLLVLATKNELENARDVRDVIFDLDLSSIMDREIACFSASSRTGGNMAEVYKWFEEMADGIKSKNTIDF